MYYSEEVSTGFESSLLRRRDVDVDLLAFTPLRLLLPLLFDIPLRYNKNLSTPWVGPTHIPWPPSPHLSPSTPLLRRVM